MLRENVTVAVCGLGGMGSNVAVALARAGVGKLILIDFDRVDTGNLKRQQYKKSQVGLLKAEALKANLEEISLVAEVEIHSVRLCEENALELLAGADIVCEAFDRAEEKAMLVNFVLENMPEKYLVASSGMCGMGDANLIRTRKITGKFYICGDGVSDVGGVGVGDGAGEGLVASRVMVCAGHEAHAVLQIIEKL